MDARESSEHIGQEAGEIIIVTLQRDPGSWKRSVLEPGSEEGGLAKASRGCDERERALDAKLELARQTGARNQVGPDWWQGEFGDQEQALARACLRVPRWQRAAWGRGLVHRFF